PPEEKEPEFFNASFEALLTESIETRSAQSAVGQLKEKTQCAEFVRFLQWQLRRVALSQSVAPVLAGISRYHAVRLFDEATELEGKLKSNANHGLLLEDFLRTRLWSLREKS